ncbi:MAG: GH92 family glycosyl hydrolase [Ferruginibacter sp.]
MKLFGSLICSLLFVSTSAQITRKDFTQYVNPFIGTAQTDTSSLSGSIFPGACMPFGMVQLSPDVYDAPEDPASAYNYKEKTIVGFSHTHLNGTGVGDLYDVLVQPVTGMPLWQPGDASKPRSGYRSVFSHNTEKASPGYYSVQLDDYHVKVELTATPHVGFHKYNFPKTDSAYVLFDLDHTLDKKRPYWFCKVVAAHMKQVDKYTIEGYRILTGWARLRKIYFVAKFDQPILQSVFVNGKKIFTDATLVNGNAAKAAFRFNTNKNSTVQMKVALSATGIEDAYRNMAAELSDWNFERATATAKIAWNRTLSVIDAEGTDAQKQIFYTGLYRNFIQPNNLANADGTYSGTDFTTHKANDGTHYSTFSLWDTYRATHPLYTLTAPDKDAAFINSMLRQYQTYGYLPIWQLWGDENYCMIGNHAIPVIADAMLKGIKGFDYEEAYKACVASSTTDHPGAPFSVWNKYHYFPENIQSQSVSLTLEIAYDDWCVAQMAKKLDKTKDAAFFTQRAAYYKNLYDSQSRFFRAKDDKGDWVTPFNPLQYGGNGGNPFTEGNAWQYFWYVPQDMPGLISLTGGKEAFNAKLDSMFTLQAKDADVNGNASGFIGQYAHGNEPSHHVAYLYNYSGQPWKTQYYTHKILTELYDNTTAGLSGNEDCGQMSAWYVFSAMGFYPVNPANGIYQFGSPLMKHTVLNLANGKTFTIDVTNAGKTYIQSVKLNGRAWNKRYIKHSDIESGGLLEFVMGDEPNKEWGLGQ